MSPASALIHDVKVTKDMLDLVRHIVNQKEGPLRAGQIRDQYEAALVDLINQRRAGKPITGKERPRGENVVDLEALRERWRRGARDQGSEEAGQQVQEGVGRPKRNADADSGQELAKEVSAKKPAAKSQTKSA